MNKHGSSHKKPSLDTDEGLLRKALPLDERWSDKEYELPEGDQQALEYLMSVRAENKCIGEVFKSKHYDAYVKGNARE